VREMCAVDPVELRATRVSRVLSRAARSTREVSGIASGGMSVQ
jgi:hypothetical protein